jgi:hypothetical protein
MAQEFFYDEQIRRFLLQFARIFSNFQIEYGRDNSGNATLIRVPVRYGDASRQAQTILQENSAASLPSTPLMTFYITGMDYDRARIQEPYHVSKMQVRQRFYDQETQSYETTQGNAFTIERLMPVPYKMTINLDIWTSNTNQKWQLFEQIATLFNPALEIQSTDNYIDWTSLSVVELDRNNYTSRTIPVGTENPIDIMTMTFTIPIWISSPAKVKKLGVVEKIIMSVYDAQGDANEAILNSDLLLGTRQKFTPYGFQTLLIGNKVQALKYSQTINTPNGSVTPPESPPSNEFWHTIIGMYGGPDILRPGITQLRFDNPWGDGTQIIGTVTYDPTDDRFLLIDIDQDTVPQNTLPPVDAVINPLASGPGAGLPVAVVGTRYLILESMGPDTQSWGAGIVAAANDIIEYRGNGWEVVFSARDNGDTLQFVTNITTGIQYRWVGDGWVKSYEGLYPGGEWSLVL